MLENLSLIIIKCCFLSSKLSLEIKKNAWLSVFFLSISHLNMFTITESLEWLLKKTKHMEKAGMVWIETIDSNPVGLESITI